MTRLIVWAWISLVALLFVLYVGVPVWFFDHAGDSTVAGMPPMLFWFILLPFVAPGLIGALYYYDRRSMRRLAQRQEKEPEQ